MPSRNEPMLRDPGPLVFEAVLQRSDSSGAACWVDFPWDLKTTFGKGNLVPVRALWDGQVEYRGSLAMMGGNCAMLLCRKDVLAQLGKKAGEKVHVQVELDVAAREVELPPDARVALEADGRASAAWKAMSTSRRREYVDWIEGAKRPETRAGRIEKTVALVAEGRRLKG